MYYKIHEKLEDVDKSGGVSYTKNTEIRKTKGEQAFRLEITGATEGNIGYIHCSQFGGGIEELPLDITWENGKA